MSLCSRRILHPKKLSKSNGGHKTLQAKVKFSADQDNSSQHFKHELADYTLKHCVLYTGRFNGKQVNFFVIQYR